MWINELDEQLSKVEDDRIDMVRLDFIAHVLCMNNDKIYLEYICFSHNVPNKIIEGYQQKSY